MTFAESMAAVIPARRGGVCVTCVIVEKMTSADRAAFDNACADERITAPMIMTALRAEGFSVNVGSVQRHRRHECQGFA
jgi:hypothetical protein